MSDNVKIPTPNRFGWDEEQGFPVVTTPTQCNNCIHRHPGPGWPSCKAFDEIPIEILKGTFDHSVPYPGDRGIQFEPKKD